MKKFTLDIYGRTQDVEYAVIDEEQFEKFKEIGISIEQLENLNLGYESGYTDDHIDLHINGQSVAGFSELFNKKYMIEFDFYKKSIKSNISDHKDFYISHDEGWKSTNYSLTITENFEFEKLEVVFNHVEFNGVLHCVFFSLRYDGKDFELIDGGQGKYDDVILVDRDNKQTAIELHWIDDEDEDE